jgi:uncharacterized membrane protein YidH (DUF202 family)
MNICTEKVLMVIALSQVLIISLLYKLYNDMKKIQHKDKDYLHEKPMQFINIGIFICVIVFILVLVTLGSIYSDDNSKDLSSYKFDDVY